MNQQNYMDIHQPLPSSQVESLEILALVRTAFSAERSLMAWIRTSVSLYTFGFSLIRFMDYLEATEIGTQLSEGPRLLGLALVCLGILVLLPAAVEHVRRMKKMKTLGLPRISKIYLPIIAAIALVLIGLTVFISTTFNWPL
jgi:BASS family bile acid:Na+ symporter